MGGLFKPDIPEPPDPPPPPKPRDPIIDVEETADVAVPIDSDGGVTVRKRMAAARRRTGRGALRIPRNSGGSTGLSIPK